MIIKAITFNVTGLNDSRKIDQLRNYLYNLQGGAKVILIQEHKLRRKKATNLGRKSFPKRTCWALDAELEYNVDE